jgi:hypothetical protein
VHAASREARISTRDWPCCGIGVVQRVAVAITGKVGGRGTIVLADDAVGRCSRVEARRSVRLTRLAIFRSICSDG